MKILGIDFGQLLIPDVNLIELVLRGVAMYVAIFVLIRVILRGKTSGATFSDVLVLVLIADAAQNGMAAEYHSLSAGIVLVATIIGTSFAFDWLAFRIPRFARFAHPERKPLVVDGRLIRPTLRDELITEEELMTQIRLQGAEDLADVKAAYLEGTGEISVIKAR